MILTRFVNTPAPPTKFNRLSSRSITRRKISSHSIPDSYEKNTIHQCWENTTFFKKRLIPHGYAASKKSLQPALYFSKRSQKAPPISYLLTETQEHPIPQQLPRKSSLLKSLCRGKGTLKQSHGFIYIQINDVFIEDLFSVLEKTYSVKKATYPSSSDHPKTHIPVISEQEMTFHHLEIQQEIGKEFSFEVTGFYAVKPTLWNEVEQVWFLQVESLELESLRGKYFLSTKLGGNPFLIAVAIQPNIPHASAASSPLMRINPAYIAA